MYPRAMTLFCLLYQGPIRGMLWYCNPPARAFGLTRWPCKTQNFSWNCLSTTFKYSILQGRFSDSTLHRVLSFFVFSGQPIPFVPLNKTNSCAAIVLAHSCTAKHSDDCNYCHIVNHPLSWARSILVCGGSAFPFSSCVPACCCPPRVPTQLTIHNKTAVQLTLTSTHLVCIATAC
jgi:hypothetical protein